MAVRSIYSTNGGMDGYPLSGWGATPNPSGCAVAIGSGSDGRFTINVVGLGEFGMKVVAYALVDHAELRLIYEALGRELANG